MRILPRPSARLPKAQLIVAAIVPALIVVGSVTGFVWAQKSVTVVVDGHAVEVTTQADDVAAVLDQAGVVVDSGDIVVPHNEAPVEDGSTVIVRRAVPIEVELGGKRVEVDVVGKTVADALVAVGADPSSHPAVTPALDTSLSAGMTVSVPDSFVRMKQEEVAIDPPVQRHEDPSLARGTERVLDPGKPGRALRVYRTLVTGGVEASMALTAEEVLAAPETRVVVVGTGDRDIPSFEPRFGKLPSEGRKLTVVATAYSPQEPGLGPRTCLGVPATYGVIAVDPDVIPLRTRCYVPGYGFAIAADTGSMINGHHIDLCFDTLGEVHVWGKRTVEIIVFD